MSPANKGLTLLSEYLAFYDERNEDRIDEFKSDVDSFARKYKDAGDLYILEEKDFI
jgi:hypothetical protein